MLYFDVSSLWPSVSVCRKTRYFKQQEPTAEQWNKVKSNFEILEKLLDGHKFLIGDELTIADISVASSIGLFVPESWVSTNIKQWYEHVLAEVPMLKQMLDAEPEGMKELAKAIEGTEFVKKYK